MKVLVFNEDNLADSLANEYTPVSVIKEKNHFNYFFGYLKDGIQAKTIVIENKYISKDFLNDYTSYYALCHESYTKFCTRVHFFSNNFTKEELNSILLKTEVDSGEQADIFFQNYLGFIVVKPIPFTVIGYTVLKSYPAGSGFEERNFWGVRKYTSHLFGRKLLIDSLAFQEQDSVLAACATSAIWAMLNKACQNEHSVLKSPSEITNDAGFLSQDGHRLFPNKRGLAVIQVCQAIFKSGLVSEVKQGDSLEQLPNSNGVMPDGSPLPVVSNQYLKKIIHAYSPIGIPIILIIVVPNGPMFGVHAITVSGSNTKSPVELPPHTEIRWLSENIAKLYAHDDQFGCFTKIGFLSGNAVKTRWTEVDSNLNRPTYVHNIIVPLYPKIRISYEDIEVIVLSLDMILNSFFSSKLIHDLVWDLKIVYSEDWKNEVQASSNLSDQEKIDLLLKSYPKYIWIARCYIGKNKALDFTFDATDVANGMLGEDFIVYLENAFKKEFLDYLKKNQTLFLQTFNHSIRIKYYEFLLEKLNKVQPVVS